MTYNTKTRKGDIMQKIITYAKNKTAIFLSLFIILAFGAGLIIFPDQIKLNISESLMHCLKVLVPTLFPFVALSSYAVYSGAADTLGQIFGVLTKYVFRLPKIASSTLILGFIGGYPSGAAGISSLLKNGSLTEKQAGRMLLFCVNPGVAFVISFLGAGLMRNQTVGLHLFLSVTISGLLIGIVTAFFDKIPENSSEKTFKSKSISDSVVLSAFDSCRSMVKMCGAILLFSAIYSFLQGVGVIDFLGQVTANALKFNTAQSSSLISMMFEISKGVSDAALMRAPSLLFAFSLAFGGICVHFQVFAFFDKFPISKLTFIAFRFLHGLLSAFIFSIFQRIYPQTAEVFQNTGTPVTVGGFNMSAATGLSMLAMCIAFLLIFSKWKKPEKI